MAGLVASLAVVLTAPHLWAAWISLGTFAVLGGTGVHGALVGPTKAERVRNFHRSTLHAPKEQVQAAGVEHPRQISAHHIVRRISDTEVRLLSKLIMQVQHGALLGSLENRHNVLRAYWPLARARSFQPKTLGPVHA